MTMRLAHGCNNIQMPPTNFICNPVPDATSIRAMHGTNASEDLAPEQSGLPNGLSLLEFVAIIASIMAINALGVDIMLPALSNMGRDLGIAAENDQQWIIAAYMLGFGSTQLFYGPLSDRFGRKPVVIITLILFALAALAAAFAYDFTTIILSRVLMGTFSASTRVLSISIVRDRFAGRQMARITSLSFMVFLTIPIFAPSIGQGILWVSSWHAIFVFLAGFALCVACWLAWRLPETLHPEYRRSIELGVIARGFKATVTERYSVGYTFAAAMMFGALLGFINSAQQIFEHSFHDTERFPLIFAVIALGMGVAAWTNSRVVERFGPRRVSHSGLIGVILISGIHLCVALAGYENMWIFAGLQFATMACFGLGGANFGAIAMESMGELAGTAASAQGFCSTILSALIGIAVGQQFNGTVVPVVAGFFVLAIVALLVILVTEHGTLFRAYRRPVPVHA